MIHETTLQQARRGSVFESPCPWVCPGLSWSEERCECDLSVGFVALGVPPGHLSYGLSGRLPHVCPVLRLDLDPEQNPEQNHRDIFAYFETCPR